MFFEALQIPGSMRLKDLIRAVRSCKTASEERAVIAKESANIRTAFKEESADVRHRCVAKLLYIQMMGYPAHFGQIECVKLIASPKFMDKKLGYLGVMLLLDENQEVLTLITNCLKNDMNHPNMYIVGMALSALGNIGSPEVARDLASEVDKLLGSSNSYLRKKAGLCAVRVIRRVPEFVDIFLPRVQAMMMDKNHSVLLTAATLVIEMCKMNQEMIPPMRKLIPVIVKNVKTLMQFGFSSDYDISGISDPFLKIQFLTLLRILAKGDHESSHLINDVLAQIAANTEVGKNAGTAVLYETVRTIMEIEADNSLRVLAINTLGRFLVNQDNNVRYIALTLLSKAIQIDLAAVQRHRDVIVECLKDPDISIRRRALELIYVLINESNVRVLVRELLVFLEVADHELKGNLITHICISAQKFAPNRRWHFDTVLRVLKLAGSFVREQILSSFIFLISSSPELQSYMVRKLYFALKQTNLRESLVHAACWCIGEYGDLLVGPSTMPSDRGDDEIDTDGESNVFLSEEDILLVLETLMKGAFTSSVSREYILTALAKLCTRFPNLTKRVETIIEPYRKSQHLELQQRSLEYSNILPNESMRSTLFQRMPVIEHTASVHRELVSNGAETLNLLDLDLSSDLSRTTPSKIEPVQSSHIDLLADLFSTSSLVKTIESTTSPVVVPSGTPEMQPTTSSMDFLESLDVFKSPSLNRTVLVFFEDDDLKATLDYDQHPPTSHTFKFSASFLNRSQKTLTNFVFQAAVPKGCKLHMHPPSSNLLEPNGSILQEIEVTFLSSISPKLKVRLMYTIDHESYTKQSEITTFPQLQ